jgi:hypothetical protein
VDLEEAGEMSTMSIAIRPAWAPATCPRCGGAAGWVDDDFARTVDCRTCGPMTLDGRKLVRRAWTTRDGTEAEVWGMPTP